jgi:hypothetical protein
MTIYEFRFENFNARGSDDYLDRTAARLDRLLQSRWAMLDAKRDTGQSGWWSLCFYRETEDSTIEASNPH